jgi:hypothetical protein
MGMEPPYSMSVSWLTFVPVFRSIFCKQVRDCQCFHYRIIANVTIDMIGITFVKSNDFMINISIIGLIWYEYLSLTMIVFSFPIWVPSSLKFHWILHLEYTGRVTSLLFLLILMECKHIQYIWIYSFHIQVWCFVAVDQVWHSNVHHYSCSPQDSNKINTLYCVFQPFLDVMGTLLKKQLVL